MVVPSSLKSPLHVFSFRSPPHTSSSSLIPDKLKTLMQTFIFSHILPVVRTIVCKTRSLVCHILKEIEIAHFLEKKNKQKKLIFGSFRLYYNWSSSHPYSKSHVCYDQATTTRFDFDGMQVSDELEKYLEWVENEKENEDCNEIDMLADLFIANCHEKFKLEKQESYRMFQEMMARSV